MRRPRRRGGRGPTGDLGGRPPARDRRHGDREHHVGRRADRGMLRSPARRGDRARDGHRRRHARAQDGGDRAGAGRVSRRMPSLWSCWPSSADSRSPRCAASSWRAAARPGAGHRRRGHRRGRLADGVGLRPRRRRVPDRRAPFERAGIVGRPRGARPVAGPRPGHATGGGHRGRPGGADGAGGGQDPAGDGDLRLRRGQRQGGHRRIEGERPRRRDVIGSREEHAGDRPVPVVRAQRDLGRPVQGTEHVAQLVRHPRRRGDRSCPGRPGPSGPDRARGHHEPGAAQARHRFAQPGRRAWADRWGRWRRVGTGARRRASSTSSSRPTGTCGRDSTS